MSDIRGYKKLDYDKLASESFERKAYFDSLSLEESRMLLRVNARLVPSILANYPSKYRRMGKSLSCPSCSRATHSVVTRTETSELVGERPPAPSPATPLHSQSHLLSGECEAVRDLLDECEPSDDKSLAIFFMRVVARNMEIEDLEES